MADARGGVVIAAALIAAAGTVVAALITQSDGEPTAPPAVPPVVGSGTTTPRILPGPAEPERPTPVPTIPPAHALPGDLGVSRPITRPACDGRFVVFMGAAVHPPAYRVNIQDLLDTYPGSEYLRASDTCPSLRPRDRAGNEIYGVYSGLFTTREQACHARSARGGDSYVKVLDRVTGPGVIIEC